MAADHDVVVIGAGFSGLYAVHKFRDELGLDVQGFEAAGGVGGTWWWNRYPGARCDFESVHYSYSFSPEIQREWEWTERYAAQPEILSYLEFVADRLDVRRAFRFETKVTGLSWDDQTSRWTVTTDDGATCTARFVVSCVGGLSKPKELEFDGLDAFRGELYLTSSWPHHDVDFSGKRVAVVGTGSTGIQVIQEIAAQAGHLTVFQRTPNFAAPLGNAPVAPDQRRWNALNHEQLRADSRDRLLGVPLERATLPASAVSDEERRKVYDQYWEKGGFGLLVSTFTDLLFVEESNDTLAEYIRDKIRARVADPATAELLVPTDHPYGTKRPPFESGYYEAFNRPNVELVDLRPAPIVAITETGILTSDASYDVDVIVLATGFDAFTGAQLAIPTTGRGGKTLKEAWQDGPRNYLGLETAGFPNLFSIIGPLSAASQYNTPLLIEDHIDFVTSAVREVLARGARTIEPTPEAEATWIALVNEVLGMSLYAKAYNSWHMGANIEGKKFTAYTFPVGAPLYRAICDQSQHTGFAGFAIDGAAAPLPPLVRLDPAVALVIAGMMNQGVPPLEQCTPEMMRALVEGLVGMQIPGPDVTVVDVPEPRVRVYAAADRDQLPVVLFLHGGGFVAGSIDSMDPTCRSLAVELDALIVSVDYRLAPEHPFPAAPDDVFAALQWARESIGQFGGDPDRIVLMGESAGANLAAVTALRARDAGIPVAAQVLITPTVNPEADTASLREFAHGPFLTAAAGAKFWSYYLGDAEITALVDPSRAESLADAAPALVITMELDPTRDEAEDYARLLEHAGVDVQVERFTGLMHGVYSMSALVPRVQDIRRSIGGFLTRHLDRAAQLNA